MAMSEWLVVGVETEMGWPTKEVTCSYQGQELILRPATDKFSTSIAMLFHRPMTRDEALHLVRRFLSAMAWIERIPIRETMVTGGSFPIHVGKRMDIAFVGCPSLDFLPTPSDEKASLALALYREALSVNSIPYQFLGYFKIINIIRADGPSQKAWINAAIHLLHDDEACTRICTLTQQQVDIGDRLYKTGRCAIAHAYSEPIVDPENPGDLADLRADLPVVKALAEYIIEQEFQVKSRSTIWREHLYELEGFRQLFASELIGRLKSGGTKSLPLAASRFTQSPPLIERAVSVRGSELQQTIIHPLDLTAMISRYCQG